MYGVFIPLRTGKNLSAEAPRQLWGMILNKMREKMQRHFDSERHIRVHEWHSRMIVNLLTSTSRTCWRGEIRCIRISDHTRELGLPQAAMFRNAAVDIPPFYCQRKWRITCYLWHCQRNSPYHE